MATVIIVGGGYGGAATAKALDDIADVVLIEPKDAFVHNIAALRGLVDSEWTDRIFYPYRRLLSRGRVIHDRAVQVEADAVTIGSGERIRPITSFLPRVRRTRSPPRWTSTTQPRPNPRSMRRALS